MESDVPPAPPDPPNKKQKLLSEDESESSGSESSEHESDSRHGEALIRVDESDEYPITLQNDHLEYNSETSLVAENLDSWMRHGYLQGCFSLIGIGKVVKAKIVKESEEHDDGQGIIEFRSKEDAEFVLDKYNGTTMPSSTQKFKLIRITDTEYATTLSS